MVEEQLGQQTKVLTVDLVVAAIDFEDGEGRLAVDLSAWRLADGALRHVLPVRRLQTHVLEAVVAYPELGLRTQAQSFKNSVEQCTCK